MKKILIFVLLSFIMLLGYSGYTESSKDPNVLEILKILDDKQFNRGDFTYTAYIKHVEKGKDPKILKATIYRRDEDDKFMLLITAPKEDKGQGYLSIEKNYWMYDPNTGKWERKTFRERIGGTSSQRNDYARPRFSIDYTGKFMGMEDLSKFKTYKIRLTQTKTADVEYPFVDLWVEIDNLNIMKRVEYSMSGEDSNGNPILGKPMRTAYYPKWEKFYSPSKGGYVWLRKDTRVFDEVLVGNSTTILVEGYSLDKLPSNIFTKAWVEKVSR